MIKNDTDKKNRIKQTINNPQHSNYRKLGYYSNQ